jgi:replication-associated recombination protein RarA
MNQLYEKFRPQSWGEVVAQDKAVSVLQSLAQRGLGGRAIFITGATGTGKSTLAYLAAAEIADRDFVEEIDASDATPAFLNNVERLWHSYGWGRGGKAYIINEAHGLRQDAIRKLLVMLERIPSHVLVVFTTTVEGQASFFEAKDDVDALLSRCVCVSLARRNLAEPFALRVSEIAAKVNLNGRPLADYMRLAKDCGNNMRRMLQEVESGKMIAKGGE